MNEKLINCPRCKGNGCAETSDQHITIWNCFGCGFTSNTYLTKDYAEKYENVLPELYKDLKFVDHNGYYWYPLSVILDDKSMVFAEGTSVTEWGWSAVKAKEGKPDMSTKKEFESHDFLEALDYIDYFSKAR